MKRSRFSEEQIIGILKEHQAGLGAKELCRRHGISDATFYKWRSKYGGMEVSDARRLKTLESENSKLKKMLAEQMMDEARFEEKCCELGHEDQGLQSATRLCAGRDRSACLSTDVEAAGRHRVARQDEGAGVRTATVRVSAAPYSAEARRLGGEL